VLAHLTTLSRSEAEWFSKKALNGLADAATVALLYELAETGGERYAKLANLYAHRFLMDEEYPSWAFEDSDIWRKGSEWS
jgi:hypothetical protein